MLYQEELQEVETPEERSIKQLDKFAHAFKQIIVDYKIGTTRYCSNTLDAARIAYLCSKQIVIIYKKPIGQDAECEFFNWARRQNLRCPVPVNEREPFERKSTRRRILYPNSYTRVFEGLCFDKFTKLATELLFPQRKPLCKRMPIMKLVYQK